MVLALSPASFRHDGFRDLLGRRREFPVASEVADAGVPAENRIVISGSAEALRLFEQLQGIDEPIIGLLMSIVAAATMARLGSTLPRDPGVVRTVVGRFQAIQNQ